MRTPVGKLAVSLDIIARCSVGVVSVLLIIELGGGPASNGDGPPGQLLRALLIAYIGWNIVVVARSCRRLFHRSPGERSFLVALGILSLLRLVWLVPLADGWWWHYRQRLMVLTALSVATAVVAFGAAILPATANSSADDERFVRGAR